LLSGNSAITERYRYVLSLLENADMDVELRFAGQSVESRSLTTYASLIRGNDLTSDIAVAYATQGTTAKFNAHVFEVNTVFATDMLVTFEREWARACPEHEARELLHRYLDER
jgi:hypothetical protein